MFTGSRRAVATERKLLAIGIVAIVFASSLLVVRARSSSVQTSSAITQQWVDQQLVVWKPTTIAPMGFGAVLTRASYDNILASQNTPAVIEADLGMLTSTNASSVRIDIGYDAWLKNNTSAQQEIASLVAQVRTDGKSLIIADAAAESYRNGGQMPWSQFQKAWVSRVETLASLFHPDYYVVIKEPGWYAPMISDALSNPAVQDPNSWLNLTSTLAAAVHSVSPNTKVGVAIAADSLSNNPTQYVQLLRGLAGISGVSFIGFDIYTTSGFENTQSFINEYGNLGKDVWIAECWSGDAPVAFNSSRATLDSNWIRLVYYFAEMIDAKMIIPFFTDLFSSYSLSTTSPTVPSQIISLYSQRTPVFSSYVTIIASNSANGTQTLSASSAQTASTSQSTHSTQATSTPLSSSSQSSQSTAQHQPTTTQTSGGGGRRDLILIGAGVVVIIVAALLVAIAARRRK